MSFIETSLALWLRVQSLPAQGGREALGEAHYRAKGSLSIDIILETEDIVYIFELKAGAAALKEPRIDRTLNLQAFQGRKVIVMELNPWRLPRK